MPWSIASVPPSYGEVDDTKLCRHIRVQRGIALDDLKRAVLKAFDDQYEPKDVRLLCRKYDDEPKLRGQHVNSGQDQADNCCRDYAANALIGVSDAEHQRRDHIG